MSSHEQALVSLLSQLALSLDGAVLGVALAYAAVRSLLKFTATSSSLRKIRKAPSLKVSDLRSILTVDDDSSEDQSHPSDQSIFVVRGTVEAKSAVDPNWKSFKPNVLVSKESGDKAVVIQRTQTCIYNEWKGVFGWTSDLRALFARSWREQESTSLRTVPFVLVEGYGWSHDFVVVNMDGSRHRLPLTTVYHQLQPINASPYTFLQALFGHEYPVGMLDEVKILPLGKDITAVGFCSLKNGIPEIKSCKDLPYFLSEMTKDQMIVDLAFRSKVLLWSGFALGSLSIGILGYAVVRNWSRWKEWRQHRQLQQHRQAASNDAASQIAAEEETGDVPDGELCVICLMRRRRSAFDPCGHLVCCQSCANSVERESTPKCPVCRQEIRKSLRIYDS
ncbi:hypothetical protein I3843_01G210100 [Carya illinoinensis]|uniref:RING-type E3 ubiquitin transferase n=1 Tax=Carya illinoinensis TaxID=32201 RepID=A0A8T1RQB8_CARIL|nr:E3 ubiquitin-protein ligase SPL2 [Carya illinoinensis]KAG2728658.1 hypothetical protein I3760_01G215100 [Carya illinoinensis]KAG6669084.1 hypothetical protein CIPAW_01G218300 [Carya illinoinensis]KAG6733289.1 hypothetical protein I3842_01G219100 [Carya illinoinensis]KAG7997412.1 hypothetical protein I3843_01G210100 [Carya illinoinensis]